ncbi:MAG: chemotaxis protein CheA [Candidatus Solibacter sp.]|nr:chemotaxis protein CheA [Candidatus Solibacter sp.]
MAGAEPLRPPANPLAQDPELVQEFLIEAREHLSNIEALMIEIDNGGAAEEAVHGVFRSFHTIKGLAGFLDFAVIQEVAHEVETLLDRVRTSELNLNPERVDAVLHAGDYISSWLSHVESPASAAPAAHAALVSEIRRAAQAAAPVGGPGQPQASDTGEPAADGPGQASERASLGPRAESSAGRAEASAVKVATSKLEYLVDMVGELVIAQSMLEHNPDLAAARTPRLQRDVAQLGRVTAEVQKTAMAMRMVPVGQLFRRMSRLVRDLARKSGKQAGLEMHGEDVELDRTLVEQLGDPLVHMIRNSMDHGLELPAERKAAGKSETGRLLLKASHQAGQIVIEVSDDGRGLDRKRILDKAIARGLAPPGAALSDHEIYHLIFQPGFSTAERVTDVSGRGVGMDVVRKQVEKLRGRIDISSRQGLGSTFLLKLPLTLAIIEGLVVTAAGERYIVPIFAVREMLKPSPDSIFTVEGRGEMALVRERLIPVSRLTRKLGLDERGAGLSDGLMIVGESEGRDFCLLVDEMVGKQEVVIKSLGPTFSQVRGISGGAILGDGRVGLILDVGMLLAAGPARAA